MRLILLLTFAASLRAIDNATFGASTFHRKFFGIATSLTPFSDGRLLLSGKSGFAMLSPEGEVLFSVDEELANFSVGRAEFRAVSASKKALVFDLEKGLLRRELPGRQPWVAVVEVGPDSEAAWVSEREVIKSPGLQDERRLTLEGEVLWARASEGKIELELREEGRFCVYQVDHSLSHKSEKRCAQTPEGAPRADREAPRCLKAAEASAEVCFEGSHLSFRGPSSEFKVEVAGERAALFAVSPSSQTAFIFTERATLVAVSLPSGTVRYRREESLGSIVFARVFDTPQAKDQQMQRYEELLKKGNFVGAWRDRMARLFAQARALVEELRGLKKGDAQGLRAEKVAVLVTSVGKLHLFDFRVLDFVESKLLSAKKVEAGEVSTESHRVFVTAGGRTFSVDPELKVIETSASEPLSDRPSGLRCVVDAKSNQIFGEERGARVWDLRFGGEERLVDAFFAPAQAHSESAFIVEGDRVVYKLDDPNNFLALTLRGETYLAYVINSKSGRVLAHFSNDKVATLPKAISDDNGFVLSYVNKDSLASEFWVIELFRKEVETDFKEVLKRFFRSSKSRFEEVDYSLSDPEFIVLQRKYGLAEPIEKIGALRSLAGLTSRNLLVLTATSEIISLPRAALSTRRIDDAEKQKIEKTPAAKLLPLHLIKSFSSPPYEYKLVVDPKASLTKTLPITKLSEVLVEPSAFESTIFVLAYGKDFLLTKTSPDKAFDQLPSDFDKMQLLLILSLCFLAVTLTGFFRKSREPANKFKTIYG